MKAKSIWRYGQHKIKVVGEIVKTYDKAYLMHIDQSSQNAILRAGYLATCEKVVVSQKDTRLIL